MKRPRIREDLYWQVRAQAATQQKGVSEYLEKVIERGLSAIADEAKKGQAA